MVCYFCWPLQLSAIKREDHCGSLLPVTGWITYSISQNAIRRGLSSTFNFALWQCNQNDIAEAQWLDDLIWIFVKVMIFSWYSFTKYYFSSIWTMLYAKNHFVGTALKDSWHRYLLCFIVHVLIINGRNAYIFIYILEWRSGKLAKVMNCIYIYIYIYI